MAMLHRRYRHACATIRPQNPMFGVIPADGFGSPSHADGLEENVSPAVHVENVVNARFHSIIFVHGLGSNPDITWKAKISAASPETSDSKDYVCWVTDFLPQDIGPETLQNLCVFFLQITIHSGREGCCSERECRISGNKVLKSDEYGDS